MLEWVNIILGSILSISIIVWAIRNRNSIRITTPEYKKSHRRKETKLLNNILDDIRSNPHEWTPVAYSFSEQKDASLINDKKNMALLIHKDGDKIIIKLNLKAAHKYREEATGIIAISIKGDHVVKFMCRAEEYMDSRGKELDYIDTLLNRKL